MPTDCRAPWPNVVVTAAAALSLALLSGCRSEPASGSFLTRRERIWLDAHRTNIVVAVSPEWAPPAEPGAHDVYGGLIADILSLLEKKLDVRFRRFVAADAADLDRAQAEGRFAIQLVAFQNDERLKSWHFTQPYIRIPVVVVTSEARRKSFSLERMKGMTMAVGHSRGLREFVATHCAGYSIVPVESDLFGLLKVSLGEVDLMLVDLATATHLIEQNGLTNLRLVARLGSLHDFSLACRPDLPVLHGALERALRQITWRERRRIYEKWIRFGPPPFYLTGAFWYPAIAVLALGGLALVNILLWNRSLKRQVQITTRDLAAELSERKRAEEEVRRARDRLEERVAERTAELADANRALQQEMEERARMADDVLQISGNERARIGRDLHDSIGQQLVGVTLLARTLSDRIPVGKARERELIEKIGRLIEDAIAQTRFVVQGLLPVDMAGQGLVCALEQLARRTTEVTGIACVFRAEGGCSVGDHVHATNVFRIAQEAVNNACKHGKATRVEVTLASSGDDGTLAVKDNGVGLPKDASSRGMGLKIMRYRAELARGELKVRSDEREGTEVVLRFPCTLAREGK